MRRPSALQIGAVVLAVGLSGSYVWFRVAQAQQPDERVLSGSKSGRVRVDQPTATTTSSASSSGILLSGSKSMVLSGPAQHGQQTDSPPPSTAPATAKKALFYGSKSAPVNLTPAVQITGNAEPPAILGSPTVTTAPTTQPVR